MNKIKSRHILILVVLLMLFTGSAFSQGQPGSNIVSKTYLSADTARKTVQRVYDNGLGDIVQEIQSYPGSTLPSLVVHHEYNEYRRRIRTWLPVTSSGDGFVSGSTVGAHGDGSGEHFIREKF